MGGFSSEFMAETPSLGSAMVAPSNSLSFQQSQSLAAARQAAAQQAAAQASSSSAPAQSSTGAAPGGAAPTGAAPPPSANTAPAAPAGPSPAQIQAAQAAAASAYRSNVMGAINNTYQGVANKVASIGGLSSIFGTSPASPGNAATGEAELLALPHIPSLGGASVPMPNISLTPAEKAALGPNILSSTLLGGGGPASLPDVYSAGALGINGGGAFMNPFLMPGTSQGTFFATDAFGNPQAGQAFGISDQVTPQFAGDAGTPTSFSNSFSLSPIATPSGDAPAGSTAPSWMAGGGQGAFSAAQSRAMAAENPFAGASPVYAGGG